MSGLKALAEAAGLRWSATTYVWTSPTEANLYPEGVSQEALQAFANAVRFEAAEEAWKELVKHRVGWELRKAVTDAIHAKDESA